MYYNVINNTTETVMHKIMTGRNNELLQKLTAKLNKYNLTKEEIAGTSKNQ